MDKPVKLTASAKRAAERQTEEEKLLACHTAIREAEESGDLIQLYNAHSWLVRFAKSAKHIEVATAKSEAFMAHNSAEYDAQVLQKAWDSLPDRLAEFAKNRRAAVDELAHDLGKADVRLIQVLGRSDHAFTSAADYDVAMQVSFMAKHIEEKAKAPTARGKFDLLHEAITGECNRLGGQLQSSTSPSSNFAGDCLRHAWFDMLRRQTIMEFSWPIS